jgi:Polysaccharide biosynthesis/export protein/SLBB domain
LRVHSFILLLGVAIAAVGCAPRPVAYAPYPSAGIDNVVYGGSERYALAPSAPATTYAAPGYVAPGYAAPGYAPAAYAPHANVYAYAATPVAQPGYTLDSGDRLRVVVFGQEGLTNAYSVDAGGFIDMPLIGPVLAGGATTDELASRISGKLRDGFIREPHVAVEVEAYRPFFILGEVTQPGQYPYVANMTAETAVAIAGGFTPRALRRGVIVNRNNNGHPLRMAVPLSFPLRPGDTVNVQERWF